MKVNVKPLIRLVKDKGAVTAKEARECLELEPAEAEKVLGLLMYRGLLRLTPGLPKQTTFFTTPELAGQLAIPLRKRVAQGATPIQSPEERKFLQQERAKAKAALEGREFHTRGEARESREDSIAFVLANGAGSVAELSAELGWGKDATKRVLDRLVEEARAVKGVVKTGQRGRPLSIWATDQASLDSDVGRREAWYRDNPSKSI